MTMLGKKVRDKITGFQGIAVAHCKYLTGCDQYGLQPELRDGKMEKAEWFDEGRLVVVGPGVTAEEVAAPRNGGPNRDAPAL